MPAQHTPPGELIIEYPSAGATYSHAEYGVYAYGTYPESSVLAGQQKRSFVASYDTIKEARENYPTAAWDGEGGCGYVAPYISQTPPAWFDEANAGEHWSEDDAY